MVLAGPTITLPQMSAELLRLTLPFERTLELICDEFHMLRSRSLKTPATNSGCPWAR